MLEFIFVPVIVGICVTGVYGLFELFARRRERIMLIEKLGDRMDVSSLKPALPSYIPRFSFSALKGGCLLAGIGLGLLIGFIINAGLLSSGAYTFMNGEGNYNRAIHELPEIAYGASVLLFGGIGLIVAFMIEMRMSKKDENK